MTPRLSETDRRMLEGAFGEGARMAMEVVVRMAGVYGASELMDITAAHIDGCGLLSEAGLEFAETLAARGARVRVPTTLNMGPVDLRNWRRLGIDETWAERATRQGKAYEAMGCVPTWSCAPYQGYLAPRFGQQVAWGESNAVVYANSVLGARTNRYGDYMDICAAVTARVPKCGLHLRANRAGSVRVRLVGFEEGLLRREGFYAVLGHLLGPRVGEEIPVIEGFPRGATDDDLKAFGAAVASAGAVAMFHAVGVTPEAPSVEAAFQGRTPRRTIELRPADWQAAWEDLSSAAAGEPVGAVVLGCPHYSFAEFRRLIEAVRAAGGRVHENVRFLVLTCTTSHALVERTAWPAELERFGAEIALDTCPFHAPLVPEGAGVVMTDSGKCAYYAPGELGVRVAFGTVAECVASAVAGRVVRREGRP